MHVDGSGTAALAVVLFPSFKFLKFPKPGRGWTPLRRAASR